MSESRWADLFWGLDMPTSARIKPNHKSIQKYYRDLKEYRALHVEHEGALETAFSHLLADTARSHVWTLIPKESMPAGRKTIYPDGTLRDGHELRRGYWEAKLLCFCGGSYEC